MRRIAIAVVVFIALGFAAWLVLIPAPMAFANGSTVVLSEYVDRPMRAGSPSICH
jgi:hypothetical protein